MMVTVTSRPRPVLHFTTHQGYSNDPHGLVYVDGIYHMFFQHNPSALVHTPHVSWGHARSPDLVTWEELPPALEPLDDEVGCWSGSAVLATTGPVIAYTRIATDDWDQGQVALARPAADMITWHRDVGPPVVPGPPTTPPIVAFRDPQIRSDGESWKAVIGGGIPGLGGCAVQYSISPDLSVWSYAGVLASRPAGIGVPFATGTVWECPQFLEIDGHWVLIVSVWEAGEGLFVAYAIGDFDGDHFVAQTWGRFAQDDLQYATTTFADAAGRPCAMSWLRESPALPTDDSSPWRSAMSLPVELAVRDGALVARFHRNLRHQFDEVDLRPVDRGRHEVSLPPQAGPWRLRVANCESLAISVEDAQGSLWALTGDVDSESMVFRGGLEGLAPTWPLRSRGAFEVDIIVDADIVEVASPQAGGVAAQRTRAMRGEAKVVVQTSGDARVSLGWWRAP